MQTLSGKVALVTGGSRRIGAAIVKRLEADGSAVSFTYANSAERASALVNEGQYSGGHAMAIKADAVDPAAVKRSVAATVEALGGLDIVVNSAGTGTFAEIDSIDDELFERTLSINARAAFYTARETSKHLRENGRIIFIGSVNSDSMPFPGGSVYALTKGAIDSVTRGLARDLAPRGITDNNIQPGPIDTELNPVDGPAAEMLKKLTVVNRFGTPEGIAALAAFLASPTEAFITGAGIKIDGGFDT